LVQDLVRAYLIAANRVPNADISLQPNNETITGNLAGSEVWWTFVSRSAAFLRFFPSGMLKLNTLLANPRFPKFRPYPSRSANVRRLLPGGICSG